MRPGVRLGVDVGRVRVGVARSDPHGLLATPVTTLSRGDTLVDSIRQLAIDHDALEIVVGLPLSLGGGETASTADAREVATAIAESVDIDVRLIDERLSTVTAARGLREAGRSARTSRSIVDQAAAVILLQHALETERSSGLPPGVLAQSALEHRDSHHTATEQT